MFVARRNGDLAAAPGHSKGLEGQARESIVIEKPEGVTRPELQPFVALRYASLAGDLGSLLAPPYDVISPDLATELRARSPYNAVRLVLPQGSAEARYISAANLLAAWRRQGMLVPEHPGVFVYRQTFLSAGRRASRLSLFAALRVMPFSEGGVLPHERTHSGPRRDRIALTLATRAQLSPVFLVAPDPAADLLRSLSKVAARASCASAPTPDGMEHELWYVEDGSWAQSLCETATLHPLLIADGHHRYETAQEVSRILGDNVKARYLLACVASARDPGLSVRPTHRSLAARPPSPFHLTWTAALEGAFSVEAIPDSAGVAGLKQDAERCIVLAAGPGSGDRPAPAAARLFPRPQALAEEKCGPTESRIASILFDRLILRRLYGLDADQAAASGLLAYHRNRLEALEAAGAEGAAFLLPAPSLAEVWEVAATVGPLPPKTTYFEPKVPSGLLFRSL